MITWMQKHNRWLVWTIWVATIAFIGAGFVGWGSYKYGSKASAVGKVGDVEISRGKLNFTYNNLYNRYNEIFKGKFDEEQAKKMGLTKQAFDSLSSQAQLLNLAKQYGIIVSEKELQDYIVSMKGFQEGGVFNKTVYKTYLQNRRIKNTLFESILADELTIKKLMDILGQDAVDFENKAIASALGIEDKIAYKVLSPGDFQISIDEESLKKEWEASKDNYLTPRSYKISIYWTDTNGIEVNEKDIQDFYDKNSFNYIDANGTQLTLEQAKSAVTKDLRIKKGKKQALLDYIAVKKGQKQYTETKVLPQNDLLFTAELWKTIAQSNPGTLIKPKPVGSKYATVKNEEVIDPVPMSFEQAKEAVTQKLKLTRSVDMMEARAKEILDQIESESLTTSEYVSLTKKALLSPMNQQESLQFLQNLFTSSGKKGIIRLSKRLVVYKIVSQQVNTSDANLTQSVKSQASQIKKSVFENALFEKLNKQFPVKAYVKGL
jgi:peptidyl-prolyl cis-trans isomerase D